MDQASLSTGHTRIDRRRDGTILLTAADPLAAHPPSACARMFEVAACHPGRTALADRWGEPGQWRTLTYGELDSRSASLGQALLELGLNQDRPVLMLTENCIEAALVLVAGYRAGIPVAPVTPAYAADGSDGRSLAAVVGALRPGAVVVDDFARRAAGLAKAVPSDAPIFSIVDDARAMQLGRLFETTPGDRLASAERGVSGDSTAKIIFTSGSTGTPKGVINTHRMLASNYQMLAQCWPFLQSDPPVIVDWLPWNHTFGSNFVLGAVLSSGGTLYVDDGRPTPELVRRTIDNVVEVGPTVHFNVPRGLDLIATELAQSPDVAEAFLANLELVFFASSGLSARVWRNWRALLDRYSSRPVAFCSAWGATETAPLATILNFQTDLPNNIGTPVPGCAIKLAPVDDRFELRVKGPNVTPGYLRLPDATAGSFDEEGFFKTGDVGRLADADDPDEGILIDGRFAENFKLANGTWVNVAALRAQLLETLGATARDVVISGAGRAELAVLIFLDVDQCRRRFGIEGDLARICRDGSVLAYVREGLDRHNATQTGASRRIARHLILARQPDPFAGELTDKGTVSQRAVLANEVVACDALHAEPVG